MREFAREAFRRAGHFLKTQARQQWQGELTLNALSSLRAYGRLEE